MFPTAQTARLAIHVTRIVLFALTVIGSLWLGGVVRPTHALPKTPPTQFPQILAKAANAPLFSPARTLPRTALGPVVQPAPQLPLAAAFARILNRSGAWLSAFTKTSSPASGSTVGAGETIVYTIRLTNNDGTTDLGALLTEAIPANTTFQFATISQQPTTGPAWTCTTPAVGATGNITCQPSDVPRTFNAGVGQIFEVIYIVRVGENTAAGTTISGAASTYSATSGQPGGSAVAEGPTSHVVTHTADLEISKTDQPQAVIAGNNITYTITITNRGPSNLSVGEVSVTDPAPANTTNVSISGTGAFSGCTVAALNSTGCTNNAILNAGTSATISYVVNVNASATGTIANQATVATVGALVNDPNTTNNNANTATPTGANADLQITKTGAPASVTAGGPAPGSGQITYTLNVRNTGPSAASGVEILDMVPVTLLAAGAINAPGFDCDGTTPTPGTLFTCRPNAGAFSGNAAGVLPNGANGTITFAVRVPASTSPGPLTSNIAQIRSSGSTPTPDPNSSNNNSSTSTTVIANADLGITKTASDATPVNGGATFTYTLTITNPTGPSQAQSVVVSDPLPAGILYQSHNVVNAGGANFSCTAPAANTNGTVNCTSGLLPVGGSGTITITVQAAANQAGGLRTNTATVSASTTEPTPNTQPNSASANVTLQVSAPLTISKTGPTDVCAGGTHTYQISLTNSGTSNAQNVTVEDVLPANTTFVGLNGTGALASGCTHNGGTPGTVTCSNINVPPGGGPNTLNLTVRLAAGATPGTLTNTATITSAGTGSIAQGMASTTANIGRCADLALTKTDSGPVTAGQNITYTITVRNVGNSDLSAGQYVVTEPTFPPTNTTLVGTINAPSFNCNGSASAASCTGTAALAVGGTATISYTVQVDPGFSNGYILNQANVAVAGSGVSEANQANNTANTSTLVGSSNSAFLSKTATTESCGTLSSADAFAGKTMTYRVRLTNNDGFTDTGALLTETLPANTTFESLTISQQPRSSNGGSPNWGCATPAVGGTGVITCQPNDLFRTFDAGVNEIVEIQYVVRVNPATPAGSIITAPASRYVANSGDQATLGGPVDVSSEQIDRNVAHCLDLALQKTDAPHALLAGNNITYTLQIKNNGTSQLGVGEALVSDALPANTTNVSVIGTGAFAGCTVASLNGAGCTNSAALNVGETAIITYVVAVNPNAPTGFIVNTATVATNGAAVSDPNLTDNRATTNTAIGPSADLQLTKTATPASVTAGGPAPGSGQIDYTITYRNAGTSDAVSVEISDLVPANLAAVGTITAAGLSCNGATPANGVRFVCTPTANAFGTHPAGVLPSGASGTITFRVRVPSNVAAGVLISNAASIASTGANATPDANPANNRQSTSTLVTTSTDLSITKLSNNLAPVIGGAAFQYTLTVTNDGPSDAQSVLVSDPLPQGIVFQGLGITNTGGAQFNCTVPAVGSNGTISCTSGVVPSGAGATVLLQVAAANAQQAAARTNTATISSATPEVVTTNNSASETVNLTVNAPLALTKTGPATVCAGDTFTYQIIVNNAGATTALGATISDPLPANTTFLSATGTNGLAAGCAHNGVTPGTVTCSNVNLPPGDSRLNVTVRLAPGAPDGNLSNTATISSAGSGTIVTGNSTTTAVVRRCVDLEITKADSPDAVLAGQDITYTISVKNNGPSDLGAGQFVVNDTTFPPANTVLKTGTTINAPGFSCNGTTSAATCTSTTATLPAGASATIIYTVTVNPNFNNGQPGAVITNTANTAVIGTNVSESNTTNNSTTITTPVGPSADLSVTKTARTLLGAALGASVTAGGTLIPAFGTGNIGTGEIEYTLTYRNNGQGDARNVHLRDVIPAGTLLHPSPLVTTGVVVTPASGPTLTCSIVQNLATYQLDCTPSTTNNTLPAGANGTIQFAVRVPENIADGTVIKNQATINSEGSGTNSATPDPSGSNNTSNETQNLVRTVADLAITKTGPANIIAGTQITYTINVTNNGPSNAVNAVVRDVLPAGVNFVSASSSNPAFVCNNVTNTVTCTAQKFIAPAANNPPLLLPQSGTNTSTITLIGLVTANTANGTVLANSASISSDTNDLATPNNTSATINTTVTTEAAVTIVKADNPDPVVAGRTLTYTLTATNNGPSDARNVTVVDTLPSGVTFKSVTATGIFSVAGACAAAGATVTCGGTNGVTLPAGAATNITIVTTVNPDTPANSDPTIADHPNGLSNRAVVNWQDANGLIGALVANSASDTELTTVRHESDAQITKAAPDEVVAGTRMDYKLTTLFKGPSTVLGDTTTGSATIVDTLPPGVTALPFTTPGNLVITGPGNFTCTYDTGANRVTCVNATGAGGNIPPQSIVEITFKVYVSPDLAEGTNLNNCATVGQRGVPDATPEFDPVAGNNESCDSTLVRTLADLGVSKTATPVATVPNRGDLPAVSLPPTPANAVKAGGYIRFDVPFGNNGPSNSLNVTLTDIVPANTALVWPNTNPFTITASGPNAAQNGATATINLSCSVLNLTGSQQIQCRPVNNTTINPAYRAGVLPANFQGVLSFWVKVNESVTSGVIVGNTARINSGLQPQTPAPGANPEASAETQVPLLQQQIDQQVDSTADPNAGNNTSLTTQTLVVANSQLAITKAILSSTNAVTPPAAAGAVVPGTYLTYRLTVTNNGPSDVTNLRVTDILPAALQADVNRVTGVKYISAVQSGGFGTTFTCQQPQGINPSQNPAGNGGTIQCTAPLMSANVPNNSATIDLVVFIDPVTKADLVNNARVDATLNNFNTPVFATTSLTTPVGPTSDLQLTKTHTPDPVVAGSNFVYSVTLTNNGPSTAQMVNFADTLPAYQALQNIEITQTPDVNGAPAFTCTPAANAATDPRATASSITCTAAELPPNKRPDGTVNPAGTVTFKFTVRQAVLTPQPTPTTYINCVTATSMSYDPVTANSVNVCDTVNVIFRADPATTSLSKIATPDPVIAGQNLTYTITSTNIGTSAALNFMLADTLPAGTVFLSATAPNATTLITPTVNTNGSVKATWAGLTVPGVVRSMTIVVRVCADYQQFALPAGLQMCQPNLVNTVTASSETPDGTVTNNSTTATSTVQAQADLALSMTAPATANFSTTPTVNVIPYTLTFSNAGISNAAGVTITDVLPKGFTVQGQPVSSVPGTTFTITTTNGVTTLVANLGVLGTTNQCATTPRPTAGTITFNAIVPIKEPITTVTNTAVIATTNCLPDPNLANNTAVANTAISEAGAIGQSYPAVSEVSDDKPGSVLFYPFYTSDAINSAAQNTRISLTNISPTEQACVHLFVVDGSSCSVLDTFICLTPNQTTTLLASDFDPGATGYIVAVAVDCVTGLPTNFNCLIGDEYFKLSSGHAGSLGAEAIAALMPYPAGTDRTATTATLRFDGMSYNRLPRQLGVSNLPSTGDGNSTLFILNQVGGDFRQAGDPIGAVAGQVFDDTETALSFTANFPTCQYRKVMDNTFPRLFNPFTRFIPAGRSGWMKFATVEERALFGVTANLHNNPRGNTGGFSQAHNMHALTLTSNVRIVVPVYLPNCQ